VTTIVIQARAHADIDEALAWYRERDAGLVQRLVGELDVIFDRICENPSQFPFVAESVQRALLHKFHIPSTSL
jgi:hypothetical protein